MKGKKVIAALLVCMFAVFALAGCGTEESSEAPEKVVIGTQGLMNLETYAELEGLIEKHMDGTKVEFKNFNAGKDLNQAFAADEIDFGVLGASPVAVAWSSDIDYQVIYSTAILTNTEAMVAKKDSGINSVKDLEGKTIATTFTSTTHYSLLSVLTVKNVDVDKVKIVDMEPDKIVAAWQRGDIDAAYTWNPALGTMKADGGKVIVTSGEVGDMGYPVADFAVVRTEFAEKYPAYVTKYLQGILDAEKVFADTPGKVYKSFGKHFEGYTAKDVKKAMADNYITGADQIKEDFETGDFADLIVKVSQFLADQEQIPAVLEEDFVKEHVVGSYLEDAVNADK